MSEPPPHHLVTLQRAVLDAQDATRAFAQHHRRGHLTPEAADEWLELNRREREAVLALWRAMDTDVAPDQRQQMSWAIRHAARTEA